MRIYNYVRPLWSNGAHVVHDAPEPIREALASHFGRGPMSRFMHDDVQLACLPAAGLTVAWILLEVELPTRDTGFSYRRARYLHVIATRESGLNERMARRLLCQVYGTDLAHGIAAGQAVLQRLTFPQDAAEARDLFAGRPRRSPDLVRREPALAYPAPIPAAGRAAPPMPEPVDAPPEPIAAPGPVASRYVQAAFHASEPAGTPASAPQPDRVHAAETARHALGVLGGEPAPGGPDSLDAIPAPTEVVMAARHEARAVVATAGASLSALLHARMKSDFQRADAPPRRWASLLRAESTEAARDAQEAAPGTVTP